MITFTPAILKSACIALALTITGVSVVSMSSDPAFAERGGNGNGHGNGNGGGNGNGHGGGNGNNGNDGGAGNGNGADRGNGGGRSADAVSSGNNGRGHLARELRRLNAVNASSNALANASANSTPGQLNAFKEAYEEFRDVVAVQDEAYAAYQRLEGLTEEEIEAEFPDGGYEDAVAAAASDYMDARDAAVEARADADDSLSVLTGGRELSRAAKAELLRRLDL